MGLTHGNSCPLIATQTDTNCHSAAAQKLHDCFQMAAPELLWRSTIPDGSQARCVLSPAGPTSFVVWDLDGIVQGVREFEDIDEARAWATMTLRAALRRSPAPDVVTPYLPGGIR